MLSVPRRAVGRVRRALHALDRRAFASARARMDPLRFWSAKYGKQWTFAYARHLVEREGTIAGPRAIFMNQAFRVEEYSILDALLRRAAAASAEVRVADIACGSGLACFFINANRERYGDKVRYVGVDSSESQLFMAKLRNPWSFAEFRLGNLYATGLEDRGYDIVLNWQVMNHVGRVREGLRELARISRGVAYVINYAYLDGPEFVKRYGSERIEAEWNELAWAFDRDQVRAYTNGLGVGQLWKASEDGSFKASLPVGATAEHHLLTSGDGPKDWSELPLDASWQASIARL